MNDVRRIAACSLGLAVACFTLALAQEAPKPGAEHERLGFWVGDWTTKGEVLENPMMPAGKIDGKTWVYDDESMMGGAMVKNRYTMVETSDTSYTFKWEVQGPDGEWMTIMQGKGQKS